LNLAYFFQLFLTSFIFAFFAFPIFIRVLEKYDILDSPGKRKIHKSHTPSVGGVPVFFGILATLIIWWPAEVLGQYKIFLSSLALMFLIGLRDDLIPLKATQKLVSQLIPVALIVVSGLAIIPSFYGLLGGWNFYLIISIPITMFTLIVMINSINLIDGSDGLAASLGLLIISFFAFWFYLNGETGLSILSITFIGAFLAFLFFNWQPSKIFMGDTGALILGFTIAFLTISFMNSNYILEEGNPIKFTATITTSFCILFVPLFDTLRVFIIRIRSGVSPFTADKNHVHHVLIRYGLDHAQVAILLVLVNASFIGLAILSRNISDYVMIPVILFLSIAISFFLDLLLQKKLHKSRKRKINVA